MTFESILGSSGFRRDPEDRPASRRGRHAHWGVADGYQPSSDFDDAGYPALSELFDAALERPIEGF